MPQTREALRVVAVLVGSGLILLGIVAAPIIAFLALLGTQVPNAYDIAGDPCCSTPDTWGETLDGAAATLALVFVVGVGLSLAVALLRWGTTGRAFRPLTVALRIPAGVAGVAAVLMAGLLLWQRDQARLATDCHRFTYSAAAWQSAERARWQRVAQGLGDCRVLEGQTTAQVRAALGEPDFHRTFRRNRYHGESASWGYRNALFVGFERGRVTQASWDAASQ